MSKIQPCDFPEPPTPPPPLSPCKGLQMDTLSQEYKRTFRAQIPRMLTLIDKKPVQLKKPV